MGCSSGTPRSGVGPASAGKLALSGEGVLIVGARGAAQEATEGKGMIGLGEPGEGLEIEVVHPLAANAEGASDLGEGLGRQGGVEAVVGHDDEPEARGESMDEGKQATRELGGEQLMDGEVEGVIGRGGGERGRDRPRW
jgi:hypothetical protein